MSLSGGFKPLSPLQEEEEDVEEGLISLAELLHIRDGCLFESELWAVCRESVISLSSIKHNDLCTKLCVCPETITFSTQGKICYLKKVSDDSEYLPPEYNSCGPTFEGHLYSLARCLLEAAEFNLPADLQVEISNGLFGLITLMSLDDPSRRPSYEEIIAACLNNLGEESSQTICRNLSSIGKRAANLKSIDTNAQERGIGEGEEQSRPVADGESGTDDIGLNTELSQHQIQQSCGIKKCEEISMDYPDTNQKGTDSNNLIINLELTKENLSTNKMSSGWSKKGSQNGSTFDNLSQRAQEILKKIYSGTDVLRDSITNVSVEETSQTETPTDATEASQEQTSTIKYILDQSHKELNEITDSFSNKTEKPSKDGRRNSDASLSGVYQSSGSSLIPNKVEKEKHCEGDKPGWKDHSVTELQISSIQKLEENNNLHESGSMSLPVTPRYKWTNLSQSSIPEEEEELTDLGPGSRKVSSCSEGKDSDDFLLNDPWSSSESDLASPIDFQRTVRSHSIATLNTFNYRQSAFKMLQRKNSETLNTSLKGVHKTAIRHDSLTSEDNSAVMQTHFNTKTKSIGNSKEKYLRHPAKSSECTRRASLSILPSAYSSKATHFTPIVISPDKSTTKVTSKEDISPGNSVKLKAKIAMEAIKKGPQVPKKIPPPITMVTDLERDAASEDIRNSPVSVSSEVSNNVKKQPMSISTDATSQLDSRRWSLPDAQQNTLRKQLESKLISAVKKSAEIASSFKQVDNDHSSVTEKEFNDSNSRNPADVIAMIPEASNPTVQTSLGSVPTLYNKTTDKNTTHNQHENPKIDYQSSPVQENVSSISVQESLVSSSIQLTSSSVSVTSASSPITLVHSTSSAATVMSPTTQALISITQGMPSKKSDYLSVPIVSLAPVSSQDVLSGATQNSTGKLNSPLPNISGPVQLCQDPQTGLFHIIPVTVPIVGAMSTLQSSLSSDVGRQSISPTYSNYSSPTSAFATPKSISTSVISPTGLPTTFVAKTDLTGVHSSVFRPIERPSNLENNVPPTAVAGENSAIPCKAVISDKEIEKKNITKKDGIKKEYRKKVEKRHGVASKLPRRQATNGTDSESSECTTYQDSSRLALNNTRMPRYMKRTVRSNRVDVSHDFEKTRSKSQDRIQGKELERSKLRDRSKSVDRKTHEKHHKPDAQPCQKSNQDIRGRKRNAKAASSVDPRSHVVFNLKDDVDDTKPLDTLNTAISPTSVSTVSRDSGVHLRYSHSSSEDVTTNLLTDALVGNKVLRKVVKLVRIAFAFDGYLENGVEDLQMAEYIVSLAHLRWMTFASAITEKFCDLYWEEDLIENLYEAVNGSVPEKSQRPLAMSPSRPRRKTEPITLSPSNTPDNLDSDDNASIIDDLLPADKPAKKKGTKENTALMRSHVVADTKLFRELIEKRKHIKMVPGKDGRKQVKDKTKKLKDQHGVNPQDLAEKLNKLEKITEDEFNQKDIDRNNKNTKVSGIGNDTKEPVAAPRKKKRNKTNTSKNDNLQSSIVAVAEKGHKFGRSSKSNVAVQNEQRPSTKSNSLDSSHNEAELNNSRSSIASGSSSHGSLSKSLDDDRSSDMYVDLGKSVSSVASVRSVQSWDTSGSNEPGSGEEQIIQTHRKPKMLAPSLPNPTTLARHSSESSSGSGSATRHKLKSVLNQKLTHASSSLSLNSTSSGASINPQSIGASKEDSILSLPSSFSGSIGDDPNILLNAGVMYGDMAVDPLVDDYTNKLVVNCETQQGIEAKIRVIDQELMMERKMRSKSQRFYQKMIEAQQLKAFPRLEPALNDLLTSLAQNVPVLSQIIKPSGTDHKSMVVKVGKQIDEMTAKIDFLESAKRNLEMLYSEQWGLDHALLYSFATSMGQEPMYLHPSPEECPLLSFHYGKSSCTLQAGEPLGLFSYLFARQALLKGYIHHFFSTYHYYATTKEVYKFIVDKFCAARSMSSAQAESRTKILCRTIDIILVWIENYYAVDFRPNLELVNQLSEFIREKIMPVDAQGECLLKLLEKRQQEKEEDKLLETLSEYRERGSHDKPKKRYSIREVLSVPTRALRKEKMRGGIISCLSPPKKEPHPRAESIYMPVQPIDKGFMMSEYTAQTLACQLTLMQQELFRKVHPVHYLNSRYHGIGVSMEADVSLASSALSRVDDRVEQDYPSLFVNTLEDEGLVHILLQHAREVSHWVAAEVVTSNSPKYQIAILCKFITIARECYDSRNLATCVQIIDALDSLIVRQVPAWRSLPSKIASSFEKLKAAKVVLKGDGESLTQGNSHHDKPTLPCSLFLLMHLQQTEVGGFTLANGMYKWTKMKCIAKLVDQIRIFQEHAFAFERDNDLQQLLRQRILQMSDHDIHSLAAQYSANFHQLASEQNSKRFKVALKKVKTTLQ